MKPHPIPSTSSIVKIYCHRKAYWNLTKPYFLYEAGKWYTAKEVLVKSEGNVIEINGKKQIVEQHKLPNLNPANKIYTFENCDMILDEEDFGKHFWTQDEFRELKIKQIINPDV